MVVANVIPYCVILFTHFSSLLGESDEVRTQEGTAIATNTRNHFFMSWLNCWTTPVSSQNFLSDDLRNFVNYPSKTTVGFAPKFTRNRKFFANMINTRAFKDMLEKDYDELRKDTVKKMKYCDEITMDQEFLKYLYDREVDQSRI